MQHNHLPRYRKCFVCGEENPSQISVTFYVVGDTVRADFTATEAQMGFPGIVHGGVITALLDECMGWAPTVLTGRFYLTVELTVRFVKSLPVGHPVTVITRPGRIGRVTEATGEIVDADGVVYARSKGKFFPMEHGRATAVADILDVDEQTLERSAWLAEGDGAE